MEGAAWDSVALEGLTGGLIGFLEDSKIKPTLFYS